MRRAKLPLDPQACAAADAELAKITGGRPLSMGPEDAELRRQWMDAYLRHAGPDAAEAASSGSEVGKPAQDCDKKNWIKLHYTYCDGTGVPGARFTVTRPNGSMVVTGVLGGDGKAYRDIPLDVGPVRYWYDQDPYGEHYKPVLVPHGELLKEPGFLDSAADKIKSGVDWVWGGLQGDFNRDPTIGQIAFNTVLTVIPLVDQAGDARDIVANLIHLSNDVKDGEAWFGLLVTIIGCIPEAGSIAKGILKAIKKASKSMTPKQLLDLLVRTHNYFRKGNAVQWLREFRGKLPKMATDAAAKVKEIVGKVRAQIAKVRAWTPERFRPKLNAIDDGLKEVEQQAAGQLSKQADEVGQTLGEALSDTSPAKMDGSAQTTTTKNQAKISPDTGGKRRTKAESDAQRQRLREAASNKDGEKALMKLSETGDPDATYVWNEMRIKKDPRARGYQFENEISDRLGDKVERAGEVVDPLGPKHTDIDLETADSIFEIKSGKGVSNIDLAKKAAIAKERGKDLVIVHQGHYDNKAARENAERICNELGVRLKIIKPSEVQ